MPESEPPSGGSSSSSKSFYTEKVAGQPLWVWAAVIAVVVGGFIWWRKRSSGSTSSQNAGTVPTAATSEELAAAGLSPPSITYNINPPVENGPAPSGVKTYPRPLPAVGPWSAPVTGGNLIQEIVPFQGIVPSPSAATPPSTGFYPMVETAQRPLGNTFASSTPLRSVTVAPGATSTLAEVAAQTGVPIAKLQGLNPALATRRILYTGESVRYA